MTFKQKNLFHPISIGSLNLPSNIVYSPLAGCSDYPFRKMVRKFSPALMFTEMTKAEAIIRGDKGTFSILSFCKDMHPIGAQICTSNINAAAKSSAIIQSLGFDVVDLNCGCPVDKVTKDGSGSALLKNPEKIGDIIYAMKKNVSIPVTIKIRAGWDEDNINAKEVVAIAEQAGASAVFIHGRTRKQGYKGPARWELIKDACSPYRSIPIFANGDIRCHESARDALLLTGADGVLISRVTMGSPHAERAIFNPSTSVDGSNPLDLFISHAKEICLYQAPKKVLSDIRRVACWYLKDHSDYNTLRKCINKASSVQEVFDLIPCYK